MQMIAAYQQPLRPSRLACVRFGEWQPFGICLHSWSEPGELSQWVCHDDNTMNIVVGSHHADVMRRCGLLLRISHIAWHCPHSMWSRVCVTVGRPSACLSVRSSILAPSSWRAGDIDRLLHDRRLAAAAPQQRRAAAECGQCHVVSWRRKLNTNLLLLHQTSPAPGFQFLTISTFHFFIS